MTLSLVYYVVCAVSLFFAESRAFGFHLFFFLGCTATGSFGSGDMSFHRVQGSASSRQVIKIWKDS